MSASKKKKRTNEPAPPGAMNFNKPPEPVEEEKPLEPVEEEKPPEPVEEAAGYRSAHHPHSKVRELDPEPIEEEKPVEEEPAEIPTALIECPLAELSGDGYFANPDSGHVAARLDRRQALALNRLYRGLDQTGARMANEKRIFSRADAVRWLLEQLGE